MTPDNKKQAAMSSHYVPHTKVPALVTVRVLPLMLPVPVLVESMLKTTALPEPPPVATRLTVSLGANAIGEVGAVNVIACATGVAVTVNEVVAVLELLDP